MKKILISILSAAIVLLGGNYAIDNLGTTDNSSITLAGSSAAYTTVASSTTQGDSYTSTSAGGYPAGTVQQTIYTYGAEAIRLNVSAEGGTATSSLSFQVYGSNDGTNYWNYGVYDDYVAYASSTVDNVGVAATTTLASKLSIFGYDPGLTTSTRSFYVPTLGWSQLRFVFLAEDVIADPDDGVGMWAEANLISEF